LKFSLWTLTVHSSSVSGLTRFCFLSRGSISASWAQSSSRKYRRPSSASAWLWSREFSSFQPIAIDDAALYLSADNSDLWSIDLRTGSAFWKQDVLHARKITAPSVIGDQVVVADLYGLLHWFNRSDGKLVGRIRIGEARSYVQPLVLQDAVVTVDKHGRLSSVSVRQ